MTPVQPFTVTRQGLIDAGLLSPEGADLAPLQDAALPVEKPAVVRPPCSNCGSVDYGRSRVRRGRLFCLACASDAR